MKQTLVFAIMKHKLFIISWGYNWGYMQTKKILGITLILRTLREALSYSDYLIRNSALSTVHYLTTRMLIQASKQPELKNLLENTDMLICAEADILRAAGINSGARQYEIDNHLYFKEQCRHIEREHGSFYLLSDTEENLPALNNFLSDYLGENFSVTCQSLDKLRGNDDILIPEDLANELNDIAPTMIISNIPFPYQLQLMHELKPYLNARMWLGLPSDSKFFAKRRISFFSKIKEKYFKKKVHNYQESVSEETSSDS